MLKVPVSTSALLQRAKRGIATNGQLLKVARQGSAVDSLGPFDTVNTETNAVECRNLGITDLANDYLKSHEQLV